MNIITVATHDEAYLNAYKKSCKNNNLDLKILGWDKRWEGLVWKFNLMKEYIKDLPDNKIVIFTDAYDVLCIESHNIILAKFNKPIVFGINNPLNFIVPKIFNKFVFNTGCYKSCHL